MFGVTLVYILLTWYPAVANHHLQQYTPLTVVIFNIVLFGSIQQLIDRCVSNTNSTRRSGKDVLVSCLVDMTLIAQGRRSNFRFLLIGLEKFENVLQIIIDYDDSSTR